MVAAGVSAVGDGFLRHFGSDPKRPTFAPTSSAVDRHADGGATVQNSFSLRTVRIIPNNTTIITIAN